MKPLSSLSCINTVKNLLPERLHKFILFGYIRNNILFFVLNHPGAKQEFDNIINSIKTPLKQMPPFECKNFDFYDVRAFVSHKKAPKAYDNGKRDESYEERSEAIFQNDIKDEKLHKLAEEIRKIIENS
jgi:hypothetical protein